jgi:phage I-like protein
MSQYIKRAAPAELEMEISISLLPNVRTMHAHPEENVLNIYPIAISTRDTRATEAQAWLILGQIAEKDLIVWLAGGWIVKDPRRDYEKQTIMNAESSARRPDYRSCYIGLLITLI